MRLILNRGVVVSTLMVSTTNRPSERSMEGKTLLSALSPQLQALVEASLGSKLPSASASASPSGERSNAAGCDESQATAEREAEGFLGRDNALAVRDALLEVAKSKAFHEAKVGAGENIRNDRSVRGDRIHWIKAPRNLDAPAEDEEAINPAILHLRKQVESLVYALKKVSPELDLRNVTSTQFAIFPGDGSRFVKHTDTYSTAQKDERGASSSDGLVRLVTCVYYLNEQWEPEHAGHLRVHLKDSPLLPASHWDVPPKLDTLVVFRSLDVEHEVMPTHHERMAVTIWYYGEPKLSRKPSLQDGLTRNASVGPPPLPVSLGNQSGLEQQESIFVAIPSYRDSECRHTVDDLLATATFPERISIGICLQSDEEDGTRAYLGATYSPSKVRVHYVDYKSAAGPCVARAQAQKLWQGERYYLQIDSHMRFRPGWDCFLIDQLEKCLASKPVLTTYPLGYTLPNEVRQEKASGVCFAPLPSLLWAAGFAFSSSDVIKEVPYGATLQFLFFGEEASMAARLWTSGWDFFAPTEATVYHLWARDHRPVFQELEDQQTEQLRAASARYVKRLLQLSEENNNTLEANEIDDTSRVGTYTLGADRSFEHYQKHIGVNFATGEIEWRAEWGDLDPIRFDLTTAKEFAPS
ncbi:hypothetical protein BBJ28_00018535 [Nothophytophthora sp. Chile5]|nr:hypothetical protein BBJ28_00018535 [Nothophytophthora sp. Chile5]